MKLVHRLLRRSALVLARTVGGRPFATRIRHLAAQHYPPSAAGRAGEATRFHLRSLIFAGPTRSWFELLESDARLQHLVRLNPHLAEKIHRPYLRCHYSPSRRLAALSTHYRFCLDHPLGGLLLHAAAGRTVPVGEILGKQDSVFRAVLTSEEQFMKEGEFVIQLHDEHGRLYSIAAAIVGSRGGPVLSVGCMQGPGQGENGSARIKAATKAMWGLRPNAAILLIAQNLAENFGLTGLVAVGNDHHIYRSWRKRRTIHTDYDALWADLGGTPRPDKDFDFPVVPPVRPISDFPSGKRADAQRRQTLREALAVSIRSHLAAAT